MPMEEITSPLMAIKQYCYECSGENRAEVKRCSSETCPLKPFRTGRNPFRKTRQLTEKERAAAAERLEKARNSKKGRSTQLKPLEKDMELERERE